MERFGLGFFCRRSLRRPVSEEDDGLHFINEREREEMRRIARGAVARAVAAGALSGLASALAEILALPLMPAAEFLVWDSVEFWGSEAFWQVAHYWGVVLGVTLVATAFELAFLYWDALSSVHELARANGLALVREDGAEAPEALGMARAALELPSPNRPVLGIDPYREVSRWRVVVSTLVYKAKITATNFVLKTVVRRLFGRGLVRAGPALVAMPVVGIWNGLVTWRVLREARIRLMGPSAAREYLDIILGDESGTPGLELALLRAVGGSIVRSRRLHPNHVALLQEATRRLGAVGEETDLADWQALIADLPSLDERHQRVVLAALSVAVVIDGRVDRRELRLLREAHAACGARVDLADVRRIYSDFVRGKAIRPDLVLPAVRAANEAGA